MKSLAKGEQSRRISNRLAFISLAILVSVASVASTAAPSDPLLQRAGSIVNSLCTASGLPAPRVLLGDIGVTGGRYVRTGERIGGTTYETPTILLRRDMNDLSSANLEVILYHELLHYQLDVQGRPSEIQNQLAGLRDKIEKCFDLSRIPENMKPSVVSSLLGSIESYLDHIYICEQAIAKYSNAAGTEKAIENQREYLGVHRQDLDEFWTSSGSMMKAGRSFAYSANGQCDKSALAGDYKYVTSSSVYNSSASIPPQTGRHDVVTGIPGAFVENSPVHVTIDGLSLVMTGGSRFHQPAGVSAGASFTEQETTTSFECRGAFVGETAKCDCNTRSVTKNYTMTTFAGSNTIPGTENRLSGSVTVSATSDGGLRVTRPDGSWTQYAKAQESAR